MHLFEAKIGGGDVDLLVARIEQEKEKEKSLKEKEKATGVSAENTAKESETDEKANLAMEEDQQPNADGDSVVKPSSSLMSVSTVEALVGTVEETARNDAIQSQGTKMDVDL